MADVRRVRQVHRWLGFIFSASALLSSGSGVIHNVMTRTQSPPPSARPAGQLDVDGVSVSLKESAAQCVSAGSFQAANLRQVGETTWYQWLIQGELVPCYVDARTGQKIADGDERYAEEIASRFLNGVAVRRTDYLTAFNSEYINIFRILPVYRFDADDGQGTRVYVSTVTGSVTRHTDNRRQMEASLFTNLHKLGFIRNKDVRDAVLTLMTFGIFLTSCAGLWLFGITWPHQKKKRDATSCN